MGASNIDKERRKKRKEKREKIIFTIIAIIGFIVYIRFMSIYNSHPRNGIVYAYESFFSAPFSISITAWNILIYGVALMFAVVMYSIHKSERELKKHDNPDTVNGEAHLMTLEELQDFQRNMSDPLGKPEYDGIDNTILSKEIRLSLDGFRTRRNSNILAIGGSGAGKTRFFASPNILQFNTNLVITDPSGEIRNDYAKALENKGYEVLTFDITDVYRSNRYNPFHYIRDEKDVFLLVDTIIKNTTPPEAKSGEPIWENGEKLLLEGFMLYLWHTAEEKDQTFANVIKMINSAKVNENDATAESALDILFKELKDIDNENLAVQQYETFKIAAGKTMQSFLISLATRLEKFKLSDIKYLTAVDDFRLETFADSKKAIFVIIPTGDDTFNFLVSMLYSQLFSTLYGYVETTAEFGWMAKLGNRNIIKIEQASGKTDSKNAKNRITQFVSDCKDGTVIVENKEKKYYEIRIKKTNEIIAWRGTKTEAEHLAEKLPKMKIEGVPRRCPYHVRFLLDEFANIGQIPKFPEKLATIRKYNISCSIIIQSLSQLKKIYKDDWNGITANCDTKLFLGSDDTETIEWLLKMLGKKTTTVQNISFQANGGSMSLNKSSIDLLTIDQISMMEDTECLVRIRGKRPHYGKKYELTEHPNYKYAQSLVGQFEIPLSEEAKKIRDRTRGPLRLRTDTSLDNVAKEAEDEEKPAATPEDPPKPVSPTPDEKAAKADRNKHRQAQAEAETAEDEYPDTKPPEDTPEMSDEAASNLLDSFGLDASATDETIKEAVETMLELNQPSMDTIIYGITS